MLFTVRIFKVLEQIGYHEVYSLFVQFQTSWDWQAAIYPAAVLTGGHFFLKYQSSHDHAIQHFYLGYSLPGKKIFQNWFQVATYENNGVYLKAYMKLNEKILKLAL